MAELFIYALLIYFATGAATGVWIIFFVIKKLDGGMKEVSWRMKLILLPGMMALWPVFIKKIFTDKQQ